MEDQYCRDSAYDIRDNEVFMMGVDRRKERIEYMEDHT